MQAVTLIRDPLAPADEWERAEVEDVRAFLTERFDVWPSTARIYHEVVAEDHDVTPASERDVERLPEFDELIVVVFPADPVTAIVVGVSIVLAIAATFLLMPKVPSMENQQQPSPNNGLGARSNRARPNGRVPDIFGSVRSVPDLISVPYKVYDSHRELEISYMCIGRGSYTVWEVRDGDTLIQNIDLASCEVYGPYSSPNDGTPPQLLIGTAIGDPVFDVTRLNEVNGQTLKAPNDKGLTTTRNLEFVDGGVVRAANGAVDFRDYFQVGDFVDISGAVDDGGSQGEEAVQAAAVAHAGGFDLTGYDPTGDFEVGTYIAITNAVWQVDDGGGGGGSLPGPVVVPPPTNPYCIEWDEPILLANADGTGPGIKRPMRDCHAGLKVWTPAEETGEWGAFEIEALVFVKAPVFRPTERDLPRATGPHRFALDADLESKDGLGPLTDGWTTAGELGVPDGYAMVGKMTVREARTYVSARPSGALVLNHNIKRDPGDNPIES